MATPGEKLAISLEVLKKIQDLGIIAIKSNMITRSHKERLLKNNFLREVMKGWYLAAPADEQMGDSTSWYASYWSFCSEYLKDRYGDLYCLSADQSLQIHSGNWTVPQQLLIKSLNGPNGLTKLPYNTSLYTVKSPLSNSAEIEKVEGLRMLTLASSLIHCSPVMFSNYPTDTRTALSMIRDSSEVLGFMLDRGHSKIAGRLAGAFRNIGQGQIADDIIKIMQSAGYDIRESDPFEYASKISLPAKEMSPYVNRIKLM